ncbi:MAG: ABC transporter ATP-binding protein [Trueperaceae bacterium]|nr:ABC transporter ATP-binding protein [Trueperaceae bacterium]
MVVVDALSKRFGRLEVLKGVSATFEPGKVTAVVGPNASGKTTLMKSILGLVLPDAGDVTIGGVSVRNNPASRKRVGYMAQEPRFPDNLKISELFKFVQDLRAERPGGLDDLIDYFDLRPHLGKPIRSLSGGTRQKASAVLTFLFSPRVLLLDEPSAGLDPVASSRLKDRIMQERDNGATVLLTSHVMSELEELADEVLFLLEGTVRFRDTLGAIRAMTGESRLERAVAKLMSGETPVTDFRLVKGGRA